MFRFAVACLTFVILAAPVSVPAGDEVDYSAPYLVVEDGKLVTKYPAKEHESASQDADAKTSEEAGSSQPQDGIASEWIIGALAIAVAIALLLLVKRGRRRRR